MQKRIHLFQRVLTSHINYLSTQVSGLFGHFIDRRVQRIASFLTSSLKNKRQMSKGVQGPKIKPVLFISRPSASLLM